MRCLLFQKVDSPDLTALSLAEIIEETEALTGRAIVRAYVDTGYITQLV